MHFALLRAFRRAFPTALLVAFVTMGTVAATGVSAQERTFGGEIGLIDARDFTGATMIGFVELRSLVFFARGGVDIGLGPEDRDVSQEGGTCREVGSGDAVNDSRCTTLDGGVTIRGGFRFPVQEKHVQIGLGYRLGESESGLLGSASLRWPRSNGWWGVTLELGDETIRGTVGIGFGLPGSEPTRPRGG